MFIGILKANIFYFTLGKVNEKMSFNDLFYFTIHQFYLSDLNFSENLRFIIFKESELRIVYQSVIRLNYFEEKRFI